jgi:hypothetical protein
MADVRQDLEAGRKIFQLLAHFGPDPLARLAASRAVLLFWDQVMLDRDPLQVLGQLLAAVDDAFSPVV